MAIVTAVWGVLGGRGAGGVGSAEAAGRAVVSRGRAVACPRETGQDPGDARITRRASLTTGRRGRRNGAERSCGHAQACSGRARGTARADPVGRPASAHAIHPTRAWPLHSFRNSRPCCELSNISELRIFAGESEVQPPLAMVDVCVLASTKNSVLGQSGPRSCSACEVSRSCASERTGARCAGAALGRAASAAGAFSKAAVRSAAHSACRAPMQDARHVKRMRPSAARCGCCCCAAHWPGCGARAHATRAAASRTAVWGVTMAPGAASAVCARCEMRQSACLQLSAAPAARAACPECMLGEAPSGLRHRHLLLPVARVNARVPCGR